MVTEACQSKPLAVTKRHAINTTKNSPSPSVTATRQSGRGPKGRARRARDPEGGGVVSGSGDTAHNSHLAVVYDVPAHVCLSSAPPPPPVGPRRHCATPRRVSIRRRRPMTLAVAQGQTAPGWLRRRPGRSRASTQPHRAATRRGGTGWDYGTGELITASG